jgi:type VI secretion system protein ImpE
MPMTDAPTAGALFQAGNLGAALDAANAAVRRSPGDLPARVLLAEMLIFAGNLERADVIMDAASAADPTAGVVVAEFRQLLRADMARRQLYREGRVPNFLGEPTPALRAQLAAVVALREGALEEAATQVAEAEALRPRVPGVVDGVAFDDARDADDLNAGFFEVLTTTGKYYWIPTERVETLEFRPPRRPRDLVWRRAAMTVLDGPDGEVYLPALYATDEADLADTLRLGRATEWRDAGSGPVRGVGQRTFLLGETASPIMTLTSLQFGI